MNYIENAVALRRELHQIPELGWGEFCTTARIIEELDRLTTNLKRRPSRHRLLPERVGEITAGSIRYEGEQRFREIEREVVRTLFAKLPEIRSLLQDDVLAAYEGLGDQVVATEALLDESLFQHRKAEVLFAPAPAHLIP